MDDGASSPASLDSSTVAADPDRTPRDEAREGPLPEGHPGYRPAGPPPPRPVQGPDPRDDQPHRGDDELGKGQGREPERLTPARRPPPDSSSSSPSGDSDDDSNNSHATAEAETEPADNGWWSDTSVLLEGEELDDARNFFLTQFRLQLREQQPGLNNRQVAGRVGALRRRLFLDDWQHTQGLATQRLTGAFLRVVGLRIPSHSPTSCWKPCICVTSVTGRVLQH